MKVAPLLHALCPARWCRPLIVHTGQHYDFNMNEAFFSDLGLPAPDFHLNVGSGSHAEQTAAVMVGYERVCYDDRPDWVVVVGDVNSTLACALVAAKLNIPVAHLEAGLRSRDRRMPEEINRIVTDAIADLLWTPSPDADDNLRSEGIAEDRIERVGNIMIDSYELLRPRIEAACARDRFRVPRQGYGIATLHRPSNVDNEINLQTCVKGLCDIAKRIPVVFPVHPRTRARLEQFGLFAGLNAAPGLHATEPLGYIDFMSLVSEARFAITDSGGLQEETTYLGIPCITVRDSTERPITVIRGTNRLCRPTELLRQADGVLAGAWDNATAIELWDGQTARRVASSLENWTTGTRAATPRLPRSAVLMDGHPVLHVA